MAIEIERKFLVDKRKLHELTFSSEEKITQGYLSFSNTVRVRLKDNRGFLTIKSSTVGISRQEFEYEIPAEDASRLLELAEPTPIEKTRHLVRSSNKHPWEIDVFEGANAGLVIAELELDGYAIGGLAVGEEAEEVEHEGSEEIGRAHV